MLKCLLEFFRSLLARVVRPERIPTSDSDLLSVSITSDTLLPVGAVNYGIIVMMALEEARMDSVVEMSFKGRCRDFVVEACRQVQNSSLPTSMSGSP
ncbi:Hypothetical protein FKW44_021071 [Caligus rogercresseyi]|uniref:Uncharacterized protein n=1 Tax=Caligus rogercresseyi TaxID=217165 RepID=A0A7T8JVI1_CALRO|nr:Hypothetical protein FKW44_021071 [Caligus rogercresseyi]